MFFLRRAAFDTLSRWWKLVLEWKVELDWMIRTKRILINTCVCHAGWLNQNSNNLHIHEEIHGMSVNNSLSDGRAVRDKECWGELYRKDEILQVAEGWFSKVETCSITWESRNSGVILNLWLSCVFGWLSNSLSVYSETSAMYLEDKWSNLFIIYFINKNTITYYQSLFHIFKCSSNILYSTILGRRTTCQPNSHITCLTGFFP